MLVCLVQPRWALFVAVMILAVVPAVAQQEDNDRPRREQNRERPRQAEEDGYSVTVTGAIDEEMAQVAGEMVKVFYDSYPKLIERFDNPDRPASRHIRIAFRNNMRVPAYCSGSQVAVSVSWLRAHPEDLGMLTHELTHAVQQYPQPNPGWLTEGIADYTRKVIGPKEQPGWALPEVLTARHSWTDSYRVSARFLEWLETEHPGTVDKVHRKLQAGEYHDDLFKEFTGTPLPTLWTECVGALRNDAVEEG